MELRVNGLRKEYERGGRVLKAVDGVELRVESGEFVSIIGRSGSGKTTLLNMLVGLLKPDGGEVMYGEEALWEKDDQGVSEFRNRHIGYVPQGYGLLSNLTVEDNVRLPAYLHGRPEGTVKRARALLEEVGLKGFEHAYSRELSGGESRRVALARALMCGPEVLIADEPTSDLDRETTREVMEVLKRINEKGTSIVMVTHELDTTRYGGRVMEMEAGKLEERK